MNVNQLKRIIRSKLRIIKPELLGIFTFVFCFFPVKRNKIVFRSFAGNYCNDRPKAISDYLKSKGMDLDYVWILKDASQCPDGMRSVRPGSLRELYELETAGFWIDNSRKLYSWLRKRKEQFYFQTWHGPVCLKVVEKDASASLKDDYLRNAEHDSSRTDCFISESKWRSKNIRNAFWYNGNIIECSLSLEDLFNLYDKERVFKELGIPEKSKIILYVPTFRKSKALEDCYNLNYNELIDICRKKYGGDWAVIVRLHPNISDLANDISYSEKIINGTGYPSVNDLIYACDVLITDYSGCMFSGFRNGKKVFLYAPDYEEYVKDRPFYFDLNDLPSKMAYTLDELRDNILHFNEEEYESRRNAFVSSLGYFTDNGLEKIYQIIRKRIN